MFIDIKLYQKWIEKYGKEKAKDMLGDEKIEKDGKVYTEVEVVEEKAIVDPAFMDNVEKMLDTKLDGFKKSHKFLDIASDEPIGDAQLGARMIKDFSDFRKGNVTKQTTFNSENNIADGGALIVPTLSPIITSPIFQSEIISVVTQTPVSGEVLYSTDISYNTQEDVQATQGALKTEDKLDLGRTTTNLKSIYAMFPVSNQLLEDSSQIGSQLVRVSRSRLQRQLERGVLRGTTTGFTGVVGHAATVTVPRNNGGAVDKNDIARLYERIWTYEGEPRNLRWVMNPSVFGQIENFRDRNSINIQNVPYVTIYGIPVIRSPMLPVLGTTGDIILGDFSKYECGVKSGGMGGRTEISPHVYFTYNLTVYRTELRVAGTPMSRNMITESGVDYGYFAELGPAGTSGS